MAAVKQENVNVEEVVARIISLCEQNPTGLTNNVLQQHLVEFALGSRVQAINQLLSSGKLDLCKTGNELVYRVKTHDAASNLGLTDTQEKLIYQVIEEASNKGIWVRDIRFKTNLPQTQVTKVLKALESRRLVKGVKSVAAGKKKVYMLYDVVPDVSVTGGAWYSNQDFETEFVDVLNQQCVAYLQKRMADVTARLSSPLAQRQAALATVSEVAKYIADIKISKVELGVGDIESVLETLVFDGVAIRSANARGERIYAAQKPLTHASPLVATPCGICPLIERCAIGNAISPATCVYLNDWLD